MYKLGDEITLPIHQNYTDIDWKTGNELISGANYNFYINWGDGQPEQHIVCSYIDDIWIKDIHSIKYQYPDKTKLITNLTSGLIHTYNNIGKYRISIRIPETGSLDTLYVHTEDTKTWKNLIKIYNIGWLNYKSFENSFCNAIKLNQLSWDLPCVKQDLFIVAHGFFCIFGRARS